MQELCAQQCQTLENVGRDPQRAPGRGSCPPCSRSPQAPGRRAPNPAPDSAICTPPTLTAPVSGTLTQAVGPLRRGDFATARSSGCWGQWWRRENQDHNHRCATLRLCWPPAGQIVLAGESEQAAGADLRAADRLHEPEIRPVYDRSPIRENLELVIWPES